MATKWVKSLQCKSNAVEDVADHHHYSAILLPSKKSPPSSSLLRKNEENHTKKKPPHLHPLRCGNTSQALKDVVLLFPKHPILRMPPKHPVPRMPPATPRKLPQSPVNPKLTKPKCPSREPSTPFPTLSELPAGHSSRRVVEIIFSSSWSGHGEPFSGEIEMLFKVQNPARTVARFEEYRDAIRSRAGPADSRCAVDGNEMMRFHCAPAGPGTTLAREPIYDAGVICCSSPGGGFRTFSGSGGAHASGAPGVMRRRAMLVCRVIAGRVRTGSEEDFESVSGGKGELVVFDPRAVLPCFLIIYKL